MLMWDVWLGYSYLPLSASRTTAGNNSQRPSPTFALLRRNGIGRSLLHQITYPHLCHMRSIVCSCELEKDSYVMNLNLLPSLFLCVLIICLEES